jgi:hypothetical protein
VFDERTLSGTLAAVRDEHVPDAVVFDVERDFETLDPAVAEQLGLRAESLDPFEYDPAWVPEDAPEVLHRLASGTFTIGAPGDGGVTWTRQTVPPSVFVKPRLEGSPSGFVDFLVATAFVEAGAVFPDPEAGPHEAGTALPETFLGFFRETYTELAAATPLSPTDTYQLANALYEGYKGLVTRETFAGWADNHPDLHAEWVDAGERLEPRLDGLSREVATGETSFAAAAELACSAIRHAGRNGTSTENGAAERVTIPAPFAALDTTAYAHHGPSYAVRWAEKTFAALADDEPDRSAG